MATFFDSCNYKKKIQELKSDIEKSKAKGHSIEETITQQNQKWKILFDSQVEDLKAKIEEANASRCLQSKGASNFLTIGDLIEKIKDKEIEIT